MFLQWLLVSTVLCWLTFKQEKLIVWVFWTCSAVWDVMVAVCPSSHCDHELASAHLIADHKRAQQPGTRRSVSGLWQCNIRESIGAQRNPPSVPAGNACHTPSGMTCLCLEVCRRASCLPVDPLCQSRSCSWAGSQCVRGLESVNVYWSSGVREVCSHLKTTVS